MVSSRMVVSQIMRLNAVRWWLETDAPGYLGQAEWRRNADWLWDRVVFAITID